MNRLIKYSLCLIIITGQSLVYAQQLQLAWKTDTVFRVPESVYFDAKKNVLYVANIDGKSDQKDGSGFISKVSPSGKVETLKWVTGLDAPKGMALVGDKLYVADLTAVVIIDIKTAKILNRLEVDSAKFLNDVASSENGDVFISDSATGKIHILRKDQLSVYFQSQEFKRINGLLCLNDGSLYVADAGTGFNYILSKDKQLNKFTETSPGADGIVPLGKDEYLVSSWGGEVFYVDAKGKATKLLDTKEQKLNSADIGYDVKSKTVFVPTFFGNSVMAYRFVK